MMNKWQGRFSFQIWIAPGAIIKIGFLKNKTTFQFFFENCKKHYQSVFCPMCFVKFLKKKQHLAEWKVRIFEWFFLARFIRDIWSLSNKQLSILVSLFDNRLLNILNSRVKPQNGCIICVVLRDHRILMFFAGFHAKCS